MVNIELLRFSRIEDIERVRRMNQVGAKYSINHDSDIEWESIYNAMHLTYYGEMDIFEL